MRETNIPRDPRAELTQMLDAVVSNDPKNTLASALRAAIPDLSAAKALEILARFDQESSGAGGDGAGGGIVDIPLPAQLRRAISTLEENPDASLRAGVARDLGIMKDSRTVPALCGALRDENANVRAEAAHALRRIKDPRAVSPLMEVLIDGDSAVRSAATDALAKLGSPALPALIEGLADKERDARLGSARALGAMKDRCAVPALIEALQDRDGYVRREAARALGEIKDTSAVPALIESLKDRAIDVTAAVALGELGDPRAIIPVKELQERLRRDERNDFNALFSISVVIAKLTGEAMPMPIIED